MTEKYRVEITEPAEKDISEIHARIAQDKPEAAGRWTKKIAQIVRSLKRNPDRFEKIPESIDLQVHYRHAVHGAYRIIYRIDGLIVSVIRVFHAARLLQSRHLESR